MATFRVSRHVRRNSDGTTWAPCWPVSEADQAAARTAGFTGYVITLDTGDTKVTAGSVITGDLVVVDQLPGKEPGQLSGVLAGTVTALVLKRVTTVDPAVITQG